MHLGNLLIKLNSKKLTRILLLISVLIVVLADAPLMYYSNFISNILKNTMPLTGTFLKWGIAGFVAWVIFGVSSRLAVYKLLPKIILTANEDEKFKFINVVFLAITFLHAMALLKSVTGMRLFDVM